ncbi:hypothetical protein F8M41_007490 [Gigaspora margarita]|uniref:Uncharacterized protein n=1 Tax=Gigaspora margarita TaxID=4874 RepID=A0A8H4A4F5_GIGMA|nr:hypothetical protein F8M41_007490 [Gigaspora margarita]
MLKGLETKTCLEKYNIFCLFDVEFPYTKQLFNKLSTEQVNAIKSKWTMNVNENTFCTDFNSLITDVTKQQFNNYEHQKNYELLWRQNLCTQLTLQLLRRHSALLDSSTSEYQYRDEIVNPLLACGEIENTSQKRQRNFLKQENERVKLGDKHDGILYMDVQGTPVEVSFLEVVGNAFTMAISDKNDDLEKLLKGREFHLLSMHFIDDMYIVDEFDAFVIPDSDTTDKVLLSGAKR